MLLVKFSDNWADEFDVDGFRLMSNNEWKEFQDESFKGDFPYVWNVGTNEEIEYQDYEDFISHFFPHTLLKDAYTEIRDKLGMTFGFFPDIPEHELTDEDIQEMGGD